MLLTHYQLFSTKSDIKLKKQKIVGTGVKGDL